MINYLEEQILEIVEDNHNKTDGHSGLTALQIADKLGLRFSDIKGALNDLYDNSQIDVKKGINNKLIFKRLEKDE